MVAAIVAEFDGVKDWYCSGTLISPTVVLTAGHCVSFLDEGQDVWGHVRRGRLEAGEALPR